MRGLAGGLGLAAMLLMAMGLRMGTVEAQQKDVEAARPEFYKQQVVPIFKRSCYRCHGGMNHRGGLNMETRDRLLRGGKDGAVLVPGDVNSMLVRLVKHEGPRENPMPMPDKGKRIPDADIAVIERWVRAGAVIPADAKKD